VSGESSSFLSRWSRRKAEVRRGVEVETVARPSDPADTAGAAVSNGAAAATLEPAGAIAPDSRAAPTPLHADPLAAVSPRADPSRALPTLDDVAGLTRESDYAPFVQPGVDAGVKNAALKKLFSDPHFNVMDGLDTYIDDYGKPDPIPPAMLRQLNQAMSLGLFDASPADAEHAFDAVALQAGIDDGIAPPCSRVEPDDASGAETPRSPRATDGPPDTAGEAHHPADDGTAEPRALPTDPANIRSS
jgi:hypothetical protein